MRCKITRTSFFLLMLCVLICTFFNKNLIVLHHGDNNFLIYFESNSILNLFSNIFSISIHSLACQYFLRYYWYCYNQKQASGAVLQERCSCKFTNLQENTKKRFRYRCFLVNSAKFLMTRFLKSPCDGCFCINNRSVYFPTTTIRLFENDVTHIFWLKIFSA